MLVGGTVGFAIDVDSAPTVGLLHPPVHLSGRSRGARTGHGGGDASGGYARGAGSRGVKRLSKIAKATLRFENTNSAASGSVPTGTATRYGSSSFQAVMKFELKVPTASA